MLNSGVEIQERTLAEDVLRQLSQHIVLAQDEERKRIARELHDDIGQYLGAISMGLASLRNKVRPELRPEVDSLLATVETCTRDVRTISHLLHPPLLDELGLPSALEWYVLEFAKRGGIAVGLEMSPQLGRLKPETETAIFRIVQEALTNVHRHSGAEKVQVWIGKSEGVVRVTITGNGRGISKDILKQMAAGKSGVGVTGMRERVRELSGKFEVRSQSPGTMIYVELPLTR